MSVASERRFAPSRPCPVCGGHDRAPRGNGERCFGFLSEDGGWAHCTREEYAGSVDHNASSGAYAHKLTGACRCGVRHDPRPVKDGNGKRQRREIEATYDYRNAEGELLFQAVRFSPKGFAQRRPNGQDGWIWNLDNVERVLYRLPGLLATDSKEVVFLVEGERDADRLASLGLTATTNPQGARKWREEYTAALVGRRVVLIPDNDEEGREHVHRVAACLIGAVTSAKVLELPDLPDGGDVSDWLDAGGTAEELERLAREAPERPPTSAAPPKLWPMAGDWPETLTAADLMAEKLPPVRWAVPGIVPEGVSLLAGRPKIGKSWMALGLAVAVATGGAALGTERAERGEVLYLALEDNRRRIRRRLGKLLADGATPAGLHVALEWPKLDQGGAEALDRWLEGHPDARLVIVDTLKKVRPRAPGNRGVYEVDYEALEPLIPLAAEHGVAVVVVHHTRKADADDPLDTISGSTGLTGGVDGAMVLKRERGRADAYLHVTGRDIEEEKELALRWDASAAGWTIAGEAAEFRLNEQRAAVFRVLEDAGEPMSARGVADAVGGDYEATRQRLYQMSKAGEVKVVDRGLYMAPNLPNDPNKHSTGIDLAS